MIHISQPAICTATKAFTLFGFEFVYVLDDDASWRRIFVMLADGKAAVCVLPHRLYIKRKSARRACEKSVVMNRIGDWAWDGKVLILHYSSISFTTRLLTELRCKFIKYYRADGQEPLAWGAIVAAESLIAVLLFIGARKIGADSAFPRGFRREGWTDAGFGFDSRGTMVTAGVYMVVRCNAIIKTADGKVMSR